MGATVAEDLSGVLTPYSTAVPWMGLPAPWVSDPLDALRVQSYAYYSAVYSGSPDYYAVTLRGTNTAPIFVPSARIIIEAIHRYTAPGFTVDVTSISGTLADDDPELNEARAELRRLLRRERFPSKFSANTRQGLITGDMVWHVTADPSKPAGSRLRVQPLDPGQLFLIFDEEDVDRVIGCHIAEQTVNAKGDARIRRQTYRKYVEGEGDSSTVRITIEEGVFKLDEWGDPTKLAESITRPEEDLPEEITSIPVYHWANAEEVGNPYGSSELRGLEKIMTALDQAMSDEDLTLAMQGLGMWVYRGEQPTDDGTPDGTPVPIRFGPGVVFNIPDGGEVGDLKHITGASSMGPYGEHVTRLYEFLMEAAAVPDIARGRVQSAESGVARMLKFAPLLAKCDEKNVSLVDVHQQMFHDILNMWYPAYEDLSWEDVTAKCSVGSALPVDRSEVLGELKQLLADGVIDREYYRERLRELGYVIPRDMEARVQKDQDAFAARSATELGDAGNDDGE